MSYGVKALLIVAALGLAACGNKAGLNGGPSASDSFGAAGDPSNPSSIAYFNQSVGDRVLFAVDQATISEQGRGILLAQAAWLKTNADYAIIIEGHADEQGTREYNVALGERRANAVRDYLVSKGIASSRLRVVSFGKERPIEICSQEGCYAKNRRAVTVLAAGLSG